MDVANKTVLITGGGTGIGAATAKLLAGNGANVALAGIPKEAIEATCDEINTTASKAGATGRALAIETDVTDEAALAHAVATCAQTFGQLDGVVANAGVQRHRTDRDLHSMSEAEWQATYDVNTMGVVRTVKQGLRQFLSQGSGGSIVIVSSITALRGMSPNVSYSTGKGGLLSLNQHVAVHYAKHGIRCNAVCPGALEQTPDWGDHPDQGGRREAMETSVPLGRLGTSADIAPFIALLLSDAASYATGANFVIDGGLTIR